MLGVTSLAPEWLVYKVSSSQADIKRPKLNLKHIPPLAADQITKQAPVSTEKMSYWFCLQFTVIVRCKGEYLLFSANWLQK